MEQARKLQLGRYWSCTCSRSNFPLYSSIAKYSLEDLATEHGSRLQYRRTERQLVHSYVNENGLFHFQQHNISPEIVEVQEESVKIKPKETLKLEKGSVIWLENSNRQKGFQINEISTDGELPIYSACPVEEPGKTFSLYVGSTPSHVESSWEDMNQWYQVQRQTKVLTLMKQRDLSSKYLPQIAASGSVSHLGQCNKPSSSRNCGHPGCGTPILVTSPHGEVVADLIASGLFGPGELSNAAMTACLPLRHIFGWNQAWRHLTRECYSSERRYKVSLLCSNRVGPCCP